MRPSAFLRDYRVQFAFLSVSVPFLLFFFACFLFVSCPNDTMAVPLSNERPSIKVKILFI